MKENCATIVDIRVEIREFKIVISCVPTHMYTSQILGLDEGRRYRNVSHIL